jgi:hypothetical protein
VYSDELCAKLGLIKDVPRSLEKANNSNAADS